MDWLAQSVDWPWPLRFVMGVILVMVALFFIIDWRGRRAARGAARGAKELLAAQRPPNKAVVEGFSGKLLRDMPAGKLGATIRSGYCPDCGHHGFYEGPHGGASVNLYCMNSECRSAFNYTDMFGEGHAERIGKAPDRVYNTGVKSK